MVVAYESIEIDDNPIEQVRLTVSIKDDRTQPALTFRTWVLGLASWPFSMKGHALITIIASCGSSGVYAIGIITIVKAFYHRSINPTAGFMLALSTQQTGLNVITELIIGFLYPGKPLANVAFKTYGYISMAQALEFIGDFKLGHTT
ncbi:hypothetical protein TanjilG_12719 [Lupinus angustifolius]|uniref:Uncharacterized protein n=1 Tax=Lupinus angustifolius TaxID=3871 RepID=A0A4P1QZ39_LUPAN|nr:hypothetical protein TanjilG_12719 [Lupinus angustifolius]